MRPSTTAMRPSVLVRPASVARLLGALVLTHLVSANISFAQDSTPGATFRSESALLELEVKVTGKGKQPVQGLRREDFLVFENGERQEISAFEYVPSIAVSTDPSLTPGIAPQQPSQPSLAQPHTWIYVATNIGPQFRKRVTDSIREFVEEQMTPGVAVSLNGAPFVWDRDVLLAMLDGTPGPDGKRATLTDVQSGTLYSEQFDAGEDATMFEGQDVTTMESAGLASTVNLRRSLTARATLYRYIDLVHQMGRFPGKKVIVLYSLGLRVRNSDIVTLDDSFEGELFDLYERLAAEATRSRVSIYAVDARGLVATVIGGDSTYGAATAGEIAPPPSNSTDLRMTQLGLQTVAELTGGKAVINTNDLGEVFDKVQEDLGDYYVLAYYPKDKTAEGRERKIRIEVNRPGVKLSYRKSYFEDLAFVHMSKAERKQHLEELILTDTSFTDIFLETVFHFYRGDNGKPVLAYNAAILPDARWALPEDKPHKLHYTFIVAVRDMKGESKPIYDGIVFEQTYKADEWERLRANPTQALQFPSSLELDPGEYLWKAIIRDERTGNVGTYRSRIVVPNFAEEASPSSLLLTQRLVSPEPNPGRRRNPSKDRDGSIPFREMRLFLDPENVYTAGTPLHFLYDLYNVPPSLAGEPPAPRVFLVTGDRALDSPPFKGFESLPLHGGATVRYVATLDTADLAPGDYTLLLRLPNTRNGLVREFVLQPRPDPEPPR